MCRSIGKPLYVKNNPVKMLRLMQFRFDVRGKSMVEATTWSDPGVFGTRAKFITQSDPAFLEIDVS